LHMSREDKPVDRTFGDYQNEAGMLPAPPAVQDGDQSAPLTLPGEATQPDAPTEQLPTNAAFPFPAEGHPDAMGGVDPFVLWAATSGKPLTSPPAPEPSTRRPSMRRAKSDPGSRPRPAQQDRRKFVKLLAVSAAGIVTAVTVGGISFAHAPQSATQTPSRIEKDRSDGSTSIGTHREGDNEDGGRERDDGERRGKQPHKKPTQQPTSRPSPSPTQPPRPSPTASPTMTSTPTGTVIGHTNQATNSVMSFTNPADGQASWLVHMSNGNFVAVEQACTHAGVAVKYNASTGQFNCPAHGAIFNADGTHPQAPATRPLPPVHITVNANGTITTP
jgi:Rieske Fe-S protein